MPGADSAQMKTLPSCPADASVFRGRPRLGAQATSRTQSVWPRSTSPSCIHAAAASLYRHTCATCNSWCQFKLHVQPLLQLLHTAASRTGPDNLVLLELLVCYACTCQSSLVVGPIMPQNLMSAVSLRQSKYCWKTMYVLQPYRQGWHLESGCFPVSWEDPVCLASKKPHNGKNASARPEDTTALTQCCKLTLGPHGMRHSP